MPPLSSHLRQIEIINRLQKGPATFVEIEKYLERCVQFAGNEIRFSNRTLQRDINVIKNTHSIIIKCDKRSNQYYIVEEDNTNRNQLLFDSYQAISFININEKLVEYIEFEKRVTTGKEHFQTILTAIQQSKQLTFLYQRFQEEESIPMEKISEPYLIKEHEGRWYLIAKDLSDKKQLIKTFGLDRMSAVEVLKESFDKENRKKATDLFKHCFGIFAPNSSMPTKVKLSFYKEQKPYLISKPIHSSQKIIDEYDGEIIVELKIFITYDFIRHLLSYGDEVEILKPASLLKQMKTYYEVALKFYK